MTDFATTDLSDAYADAPDAGLRHLDPVFFDFGGKHAFHGPVVTLATFEDNTKVREAVESEGAGRVLVVDGGGSKRCALFGGNLAQLAAKNGWAGVVVNGCVRDRGELEAEAVGVKALAAHPKKSVKRGLGDFDVPVTFAGVTISPGDYLYADRDGIIVAAKELSLPA
jgi:regulator of ribonuclease activity A